MSITSIAQYITIGLALALILRFSVLRLHSVYSVFCAFLVVDLFSSLVFFFEKLIHRPRLDYWVTWMMLRPIAWVLTLWMVYALLEAMLAKLPGILRLSRRILNIAFAGALILALSTALPEYSASGLAGSPDPIRRALAAVFVLERVIFMAALFLLLAMLAFILWFPIQMPRNLAVFSIGFVVYFSAMTAALLINTYWPHYSRELLGDAANLVLAACYGYWLILINRVGETRPVRIGHSWQPGEQKRLVGELEAMNAALLRVSRR